MKTTMNITKDAEPMLYIAVGTLLERDGAWVRSNTEVIDLLGYRIKLSAEIVAFPAPDFPESTTTKAPA